MGHTAFSVLCTIQGAAIFREASVIQGRLLLSGHVTMCLRVPLVPKRTEVLLLAPEPQEKIVFQQVLKDLRVYFYHH